MYVCMHVCIYVPFACVCMQLVHTTKVPSPNPRYLRSHTLPHSEDRKERNEGLYTSWSAGDSLSLSLSLSLSPLYQVCIEKTGEMWRVKQIMAKMVIFMLQVLCASSLLSACFFDNKHDDNKDDAHRTCSPLFFIKGCLLFRFLCQHDGDQIKSCDSKHDELASMMSWASHIVLSSMISCT